MGRQTMRRHSSGSTRRRSRAEIPVPWSRSDVWIALAFFGSGAAGLIYEISWLRQIGLLFGHTVQAASIVVGSFFAGMGLGYLIAARLLRRARPLIGYALAEWIAGGWACLIPVLLAVLERPAFAAVLHHSNPIVQTVVRSIVCLALLLPATIALGTTLPFIAEYLDPAGRRTGARVAVAYALNTVGALLGVLLATMFLLVWVGVRKSSYLAAGISVICGLIAYRIDRAAGGAARIAPARQESARAGHPIKRFWLGLVVLSGFGTLALQMLYNQMFALVFHNSVYTFGMILAIFLASLALGASLAPRLVRRWSAEAVVAWASLVGGAAVALSMLAFGAVTGLREFQAGQSFGGHMAAVLGLVALIVGGPLTILGVLLPTAWQGARADQAGSGRTVGVLTAANTIAATLGSLAAAFLLMPILGLWPATLSIAGLFWLVGSSLMWRRHRWGPILWTGGVFGISAVLACIILSQAQNRVPENPNAVVMRRWQTPYGWLDVVSEPRKNWLALRENLHYVHGATDRSMERELRQGYLPLLLHPAPRQTLFLGLGTGLTAGAALRHPEVKQIAVVELIPEVVEAAKLFGEANNHLLADPRAEVHVDDARHWLLASDERFDVIVSDLFVPWQSQAGYLYTTDHYRLVRRHLGPDGIFCQWLALNQVGQTEFEIIANSFASVFPVTTLWWGRLTPQQGMVMFVGSEQAVTLDGSSLPERLERLRASGQTDPYLQSVTYLYRLYAGRWQAQPDAPLNSDEHPRIEFLSPMTYRNRRFLTYHSLMTYFDKVLSRLPAEGVNFTAAPDAPLEDLAARHALQRQVLQRQMQGKR